MAAYALLALRLAALRRADMEGDPFVDPGADSSAELNGYINAAVREMYALIISRFDDTFLQMSGSTTLSNSGVNYYAIGKDVKVRGVDRLEGSTWRALSILNWRERSNDDGQLRWRLSDQKVEIFPVGRHAGTYRHWFYPVPADMINGTDTVELYLFPQFVEISAAIQCLIKSQLDASALVQERELVKASMLAYFQNRMGEPEQAPIPSDAGGSWWGW